MAAGVQTQELEALMALAQQLCSEDVAEVPGARLRAEVEGLSRLMGCLEVELIRRAGAWERSGDWALDGSKSAAAAVARRCAVAPGTARDRLRLARRLEAAPKVAAAASAGRLSMAKARHLCALVADDRSDTLRDAFGRAEDDLVAAAERVSVRDTAWLARHFFAAADPDGFEADCDKDYERNRFDVAQSFEGTGHVDGFLDAESTAIVRHALAAMEDRLYRAQAADDDSGDGAQRTPAQRRAEAFVAICASVIDDDPDRDHTTTGVARPVITALLDLADTLTTDAVIDDTDHPDDPVIDLTGSEPAVVLAESNQPLPRSSRQRLLCDAVFVRVLTKGGSEPLDIGRARRNPTTALARALVCRDGGCAFPGCETPARFCEAHHIHHWEHGGPTALSNLTSREDDPWPDDPQSLRVPGLASVRP